MTVLGDAPEYLVYFFEKKLAMRSLSCFG